MFVLLQAICKEVKNILHVSTEYLENSPIENESNKNINVKYCMSKEYGGCKDTISENICAAGMFYIFLIIFPTLRVLAKPFPVHIPEFDTH